MKTLAPVTSAIPSNETLPAIFFRVSEYPILMSFVFEIEVFNVRWVL